MSMQYTNVREFEKFAIIHKAIKTNIQCWGYIFLENPPHLLHIKKITWQLKIAKRRCNWLPGWCLEKFTNRKAACIISFNTRKCAVSAWEIRGNFLIHSSRILFSTRKYAVSTWKVRGNHGIQLSRVLFICSF